MRLLNLLEKEPRLQKIPLYFGNMDLFPQPLYNAKYKKDFVSLKLYFLTFFRGLSVRVCLVYL
jgi:hypothetical protein